MEQIIDRRKRIIRPSDTKQSEKVKPVKFNPFLSEFRCNPYPTYHRLRSESPIYRSPVGGDWVLTRYEDIKTILRERRVYSHDQPKLIKEKSKYLQKQGKNLHVLADISNKFLFYMNPPDHTRLRSLVGKAFSPVVIERMRPQIQTLVDEFLDKVQSKGEMDIIANLAGPLPVKVIARMLGVPLDDAQDKLKQWTQVLSRIIDSLISFKEYEIMNEKISEFQE